MALNVGGDSGGVAPRTLFYSMNVPDSDDEESEDHSRRGRRRRPASNREGAESSSSATAQVANSGLTRAGNSGAAASSGLIGAGGAQPLPSEMFVTNFGEAVLRGVIEAESLRAAVTYGPSSGLTGVSAAASFSLTGAGAAAGGSSSSAGAWVTTGPQAPASSAGFSLTEASRRPLEPTTPTKVPHSPDSRCPYEHEEEVMAYKFMNESHIAARLQAEYDEIKIIRELQLAEARREVNAARERAGHAEAHAQRSQHSVDQAMQQLTIEYEAQQLALDAFHM